MELTCFCSAAGICAGMVGSTGAWARTGGVACDPKTHRKEDAMKSCRYRFLAVLFIAAMAVPAAGETAKRGGILTFMIPADAAPSFDAHRETTYATVHAAAPFYSVLIRVNPDNPSSTTDFVCDL